MKQYTVDGRDNSTLNFNCQIDEEFYVLLQRSIDPDGTFFHFYAPRHTWDEKCLDDDQLNKHEPLR